MIMIMILCHSKLHMQFCLVAMIVATYYELMLIAKITCWLVC